MHQTTTPSHYLYCTCLAPGFSSSSFLFFLPWAPDNLGHFNIVIVVEKTLSGVTSENLTTPHPRQQVQCNQLEGTGDGREKYYNSYLTGIPMQLN